MNTTATIIVGAFLVLLPFIIMGVISIKEGMWEIILAMGVLASMIVGAVLLGSAGVGG